MNGVSEQELQELVGDRSDEEITTEVEARGGAESVVERVLATLCSRFRADEAGDRQVVIEWSVRERDRTHVRQLRVEAGACRLASDPGDARVRLALSLPDFLRFFAGALDPMDAFTTGRLQVSGDLVLAQSMGTWFRA